MLTILMTSEYELFANGRGCPKQHLLEPTDRMLRLLDRYGAKLTIHADAAEIMRFRDLRDETGYDDYQFEPICAQLRRAISTGHDVQLHLHASYFGATHEDGYWRQDYNAHDLAQLPYDQQVQMLALGKGFLENMLRPVDENYRCYAFRASNWSMQPTRTIARALRANGIKIDSSVWKYGVFRFPVQFDYRTAHSAMIPWPIDDNEVCQFDPNNELFEVPIYSELQPIQRFLSTHRVARAIDRRINSIWKDPELAAHVNASPTKHLPAHDDTHNVFKRIGRLFSRHPLKMDFNQCSGRQLAAGLRRAERRYATLGLDLPFVVFGHSRTFTGANARSLQPFLDLVASNPTRFRFGLFSDLDLESYRLFWRTREECSVETE